jgi:hypothetical protein
MKAVVNNGILSTTLVTHIGIPILSFSIIPTPESPPATTPAGSYMELTAAPISTAPTIILHSFKTLRVIHSPPRKLFVILAKKFLFYAV